MTRGETPAVQRSACPSPACYPLRGRSSGEIAMGTSKPGIRTEIIPYIFYRDVPAALAWLARAFGFTQEMRHATPSGMHAQMKCDGQRIMMGTRQQRMEDAERARNRGGDAGYLRLSR